MTVADRSSYRCSLTEGGPLSRPPSVCRLTACSRCQRSRSPLLDLARSSYPRDLEIEFGQVTQRSSSTSTLFAKVSSSSSSPSGASSCLIPVVFIEAVNVLAGHQRPPRGSSSSSKSAAPYSSSRLSVRSPGSSAIHSSAVNPRRYRSGRRPYRQTWNRCVSSSS